MPAELVLPGHGEPINDHVALIDERFRMHQRRADEDPRPDRRAAAHRLRDRPGDVGQRRGDPGLPHALGGPRPRRPPARATGARASRRGRGDAVRCAAGACLARLSISPGARRSRGRRRRRSARRRTRRRGSPRSSACGRRAQRQREHVGVVPAPRAFGGGRVDAQRRPDARRPCWRRSRRPCRSSSRRRPARRAPRPRRARPPRSPRPSPRAHPRPARREGSARGRAARSSSTTASATPTRSSAATAMRIDRV